MATCGEALIQILESYGVDTVFGIPGVHTVELYRGLPQTNIRHITFILDATQPELIRVLIIPRLFITR